MSIFIPPSISNNGLLNLTLEKGEICFNRDDENFYTGNGKPGGKLIFEKQDLTNVNSNISTISSSISGFNQDLTNVNSNISTISSSISGFNQDLTNVNSNISTISSNLKTEITNISNDLTEVLSLVSQNEDKILSSETNISELKNKDELFNTNISELSSNLDESKLNINDILTRLNNLENNFNVLKNSFDIDIINSDSSNGILEYSNENKSLLINGSFTQTKDEIKAKEIVINNASFDVPSGLYHENFDDSQMLLNANSIKIGEGTTFKGNRNDHSNIIKAVNVEKMIIKNVTFTGPVYNTLMTGQSNIGNMKELKELTIENCDFNEDCAHTNIWFAEWQNNAVLNIKNCHFKHINITLGNMKKEGVDNKLTVNFENCVIDSYDHMKMNKVGYDYAGIFLIDNRYNYKEKGEPEIHPFANVTINIKNVMAENKKLTQEGFKMGTSTKDQMLFYYETGEQLKVINEKTGKTEKTPAFCRKYADNPDIFPTVNVE